MIMVCSFFCVHFLLLHTQMVQFAQEVKLYFQFLKAVLFSFAISFMLLLVVFL